MLTNLQLGKFALIATATFSLVACESSGSYRLASVGTVPDGSSSGGTASSGGGDGSNSSSSGGTASSSSGGSSSSGSSSGGATASSSSGGSSSSSSGGAGPLGGPIIVTAGNAVIGVAGKHNQLATLVNGKVPAATPVTATVTRVLTKTGQTLVNLGNGNSLILNKAGGKIGDVLKIDLGSKTVIGAPSGSPLLGVGVLSPAGSGNIATVTSSALPGTGAVPNVTGALPNVTGAIAPVTTAIGAAVGGSVTTPVTTITGGAAGGASVTTGVTNTVGGLLGGLKKTK